MSLVKIGKLMKCEKEDQKLKFKIEKALNSLHDCVKMDNEDKKWIFLGQLKEQGIKSWLEAGEIIFSNFFIEKCDSDLAIMQKNKEKYVNGILASIQVS